MNVAYHITTKEAWEEIKVTGFLKPLTDDLRFDTPSLHLGKVSNDRWLPGKVCLEVKFDETPVDGNRGHHWVVFKQIPLDNIKELTEEQVRELRPSIINGKEYRW